MLLNMFILTVLGYQNVHKDLDYVFLKKSSNKTGMDFELYCIFIYKKEKMIFKRIINHSSKYHFNSFNFSVLKINIL
jgi:hypothetical protein